LPNNKLADLGGCHRVDDVAEKLINHVIEIARQLLLVSFLWYKPNVLGQNSSNPGKQPNSARTWLLIVVIRALRFAEQAFLVRQ
jgi:hypothetical protein